jgi:hypothetical protein
MNEPWQYQLRIYLSDESAAAVRNNCRDGAVRPLTEVLSKHDATLVSQFEAFENYVLAAEKEGPENFPLYKWTKATIEDPVKRAKHSRTFAIHVADNEVYSKEAADALESDLRPLVGGGVVTRMSKHDTNPVNNLQVPPEYRS